MANCLNETKNHEQLPYFDGFTEIVPASFSFRPQPWGYESVFLTQPNLEWKKVFIACHRNTNFYKYKKATQYFRVEYGELHVNWFQTDKPSDSISLHQECVGHQLLRAGFGFVIQENTYVQLQSSCDTEVSVFIQGETNTLETLDESYFYNNIFDFYRDFIHE